MWSRIEIKQYAKDFLRKNYWKAFLIVLITTFATSGVIEYGAKNNNQNINQSINQFNFLQYSENLPNQITNSIKNRIINSPVFALGFGFFVILAFLLSLLLITLGFVLEVGQSRFFLDGFKGDVEISKLLSGFNRKEYFNIVKTQLLRRIYIILWTMLLVIPGIIKSIEYSFIPYILAENNNLSASEAIAKSKSLTYGHKLDMFFLNISFFGWYLLNTFTFGLASYFIEPYVVATNARLYEILANNHLEI